MSRQTNGIGNLRPITRERARKIIHAAIAAAIENDDDRFGGILARFRARAIRVVRWAAAGRIGRSDGGDTEMRIFPSD